VKADRRWWNDGRLELELAMTRPTEATGKEADRLRGIVFEWGFTEVQVYERPYGYRVRARAQGASIIMTFTELGVRAIFDAGLVAGLS
jgi:hypothetical protein